MADKITKAIFVGSIATGFGIRAIANESDSIRLAKELITDGVYAEIFDIKSPSLLDKKFKPFTGGINFIVFGSGLGNGFELYGPFEDIDIAEQFAEDNRSDSDEWESFVFTPLATQNESSASMERQHG